MASREAVVGGLASVAELAPPQPGFSEVEAAQVQDYFEYRFPFSIRLPARQSALLSPARTHVIGALLSVPDVDARDLFVALLPHRDSVLRSIAARRANERGSSRFASELDELRRRYVAAVLGQGPETAERVNSLAQAIEGLEVLQGSSAQLAVRDPDDPACAGDAQLLALNLYGQDLAFARERAANGGATITPGSSSRSPRVNGFTTSRSVMGATGRSRIASAASADRAQRRSPSQVQRGPPVRE